MNYSPKWFRFTHQNGLQFSPKSPCILLRSSVAPIMNNAWTILLLPSLPHFPLVESLSRLSLLTLLFSGSLSWFCQAIFFSFICFVLKHLKSLNDISYAILCVALMVYNGIHVRFVILDGTLLRSVNKYFSFFSVSILHPPNKNILTKHYLCPLLLLYTIILKHEEVGNYLNAVMFVTIGWVDIWPCIFEYLCYF